MFDDFVNIFEKKTPPREPEYYADKVYVINRWLSNDPDLIMVAAELGKYVSVLGGRYYHLLWSLIPKSRFYIKYPKTKRLDERERVIVRAVQRVFCCSGREAYLTKQILEKDGVNVERMLGLNREGGQDERALPIQEKNAGGVENAAQGNTDGKESAIQRLRDASVAVRSKKKSSRAKVSARTQRDQPHM